MEINNSIKNSIKNNVLDRFLRYVQFETTSNPQSKSYPSTPAQFTLAKELENELNELGLESVYLDENCYLYGTLPTKASNGSKAISLCAHLDTSPDSPGGNVRPVIHENYQGGSIRFPDDEQLILSPQDSRELLKFVGEDIVTSSGKTLLGGDDKAGIAEIMTALEIFIKNPELSHPEIRVCFTPDEEIGRGVDHIDLDRLADVCLTIDGGFMGEVSFECFHALSVKISFQGNNVHPGEGKNKMINAALIASKFVNSLPEWQFPEHSEKREGFFHLTNFSGMPEMAEIELILRDFDSITNYKRLDLIHSLKDLFFLKYPGINIEIEHKEQYKNMKEVLEQYPGLTELCFEAIRLCEVPLRIKPIRGGTDGSRLAFLGIPTPNLFTGSVLMHSRKEWIPVIAMQKSVETIIQFCDLWIHEKYPE